MSCLETRLLVCQRLCSDHILPNILSREKRIYNYRHARARRVVECTFGNLRNKWHVRHSVILVHPNFASTIVQCCCVLHNFVRKRDGFVFEDTLSCELQGVQKSDSAGERSQGIQVREMSCEYFNGPGALPWQNKRGWTKIRQIY
jgi:hypothetical protein